MELWNSYYTKLWLDSQDFDLQLFTDPIDGVKLLLLDLLSYGEFWSVFLKLLWLLLTVSPTEWIRLKKLMKNLGSEKVRWPEIH
jgi:hypothetical protein